MIQNYFNYFTEIEEHFQRARGTSLFLLSPLDWALVESWKNSDIPLEAVLRGIDDAFEKWRTKRIKTQQVNGLAFCAQAVLTEAQRTPGPRPKTEQQDAFTPEEVKAFLEAGAAALRDREAYQSIADSLEALSTEPPADLEELEQRLSILEQKMIAIARADQPEDAALDARRDLDAQLAPYRRKMSAPQLAMLERQFLERRLIEQANLPRLSLFYLR
ncbi:hypothetical protein [Nevskia soli]|uniref:hypothetical protein n=1 Tax=Nevskia soli TaxID=418856 RepID=UPI001C5CC0C6|nr:hypothetical protein [Nevskia soli]